VTIPGGGKRAIVTSLRKENPSRREIRRRSDLTMEDESNKKERGQDSMKVVSSGKTGGQFRRVKDMKFGRNKKKPFSTARPLNTKL